MIFLLSASGMSLSNKLSSVSLKYPYPLFECFINNLCGVQAVGHLLQRVLGSDTFYVPSFQVFDSCR